MESANLASAASSARVALQLIDEGLKGPAEIAEIRDAAQALVGLLESHEQTEIEKRAAYDRSMERYLDSAMRRAGNLLAMNPEDPRYRLLLGDCKARLAFLKLRGKIDPSAVQAMLAGNGGLRDEEKASLEAGLALFDESIALLPPELGSAARSIRLARLGRGSALLQLGRFTEGLLELESVTSESEEEDWEANAGFEWLSFWEKLRFAVIRGAEIEQSRMPWSRGPSADHARAIRLAEGLARLKGVSPAAIYNVACVFSLASAEEGVSLSERDRRARKAVSYLESIEKQGYFVRAAPGLLTLVTSQKDTINQLRRDHDLNPLRGGRDFQILVSTAEANAGAK